MKPNLPEHIWEDTAVENFNGDRLGLDWMFPRAPKENSYYIEIDNSNIMYDNLKTVIINRWEEFQNNLVK